jgi:hypothetical protein
LDNRTVIIAGRGPSVYGFDFPEDVPVLAVASAAFALQHVPLWGFCTLDTPKYFMEPLGKAETAWHLDEKARPWPFWASADLVKHVPQVAAKNGHVRPMIPYEVLAKLPDHDRKCIEDVFLENPSLVGYQPGWLDYPNVRAWDVVPQSPPNFGTDGELGLWSQAASDADFDAVRHSLLFAVQLVARHGFKRVEFIGCDLLGKRFPVQRATMREWMPLAESHGIEWVNLGAGSALGDFMPTSLEVAA